MHSLLRVYPGRHGVLSGRCGVVFGAVCLVVTACGDRPASGTSAANTAAAPNVAVCELLTTDEVARVLGSAVSPPQEQIISPAAPERASISQCVFNAEGSTGKSVTLFLRRSPVRDYNPEPVRRTLSESGASVTDVPRIGKAALWSNGTLHVFDGEKTYFILTIRGVPDDKALESARQLASTVLTRLPAR